MKSTAEMLEIRACWPCRGRRGPADLIAVAVTNAQARARLEQEMARLCAAGEPLSLSDLKPKPVAPETNAATYLASCQERRSGDQKGSSRSRGGRQRGRIRTMRRATRPGPVGFRRVRQARSLPERGVALAPGRRTARTTTLSSTTRPTQVPCREMLSEFRTAARAFRVLNYRAMLLAG